MEGKRKSLPNESRSMVATFILISLILLNLMELYRLHQTKQLYLKSLQENHRKLENLNQELEIIDQMIEMYSQK